MNNLPKHISSNIYDILLGSRNDWKLIYNKILLHINNQKYKINKNISKRYCYKCGEINQNACFCNNQKCNVLCNNCVISINQWKYRNDWFIPLRTTFY